jgi:putative ABC transport system permease protein
MGREQPVDAEIVGVTRDGKYADVGESSQPYLYLPLMQEAWTDMALTATTTGDPRALVSAVRKAMHDMDPDALVETTETMTDHMKLATYMNRMAAGLTASLGGLALVLTVIGLYGVIAYSVSRRTQEIGIRVALGARRSTVAAKVLGDGLKLVMAGMVVGVVCAVVAGRWASSLVFGVQPLDPVALLSVAAVMLGVSGAALIAPARRALRVDPAVALRDE